MKRFDNLLNILQGGAVLAVIVCFIQWFAAWIMLIINLKTAVLLFILAGLTFVVCVLLIFTWSCVLRKARKKAVRIAYNVFDKMRSKVNLTGNIKVEMVANYIVWITFYTDSVGVINKQKIISEVQGKIGNLFRVAYEEYSLAE